MRRRKLHPTHQFRDANLEALGENVEGVEARLLLAVLDRVQKSDGQAGMLRQIGVRPVPLLPQARKLTGPRLKTMLLQAPIRRP